ncbi:MAG: tRNA glutamyl-Q(34) synthetase GluQRS [Atopobiaceae bacterium]|nr:tRNA glutamyl-Q(34) synthetase GluQRS [Atopobiaceae bacterium]
MNSAHIYKRDYTAQRGVGVSSHTAPRGRFAPSPSGRMHLGNVLSCLVAWLGARSTGGSIVMRVEDLDERSSKRALAELLMDDLTWLGLDWDEGPFWQSERTSSYQHALDQLSGLGLTYPCFCTRGQLHAAQAPHSSDGSFVYQGTCKHLSAQEIELRAQTRNPALRLCVPAPDSERDTISFDDLVYGKHAESLARECGDFLIRRSDGVFAYQLAVVVDDAAMGVTQVVRGRDLLGSTARQIYLQELLGISRPAYAHVPLLVAPDGRRLSKRDRDLDLGVLRERFGSPEPIIGKLAQVLGLIEDVEPVSAAELLGQFSWDCLREHRGDIVVGSDFLDRLD